MEGKKILIVDDELVIVNMIKRNLERTGEYRVMAETKGTRALSVAKRFKPDLILLDIRMPDKNGLEVLEELKKDKKTISIPVIILTAVDSEKAKSKAFRQYDEDYLVKPVTDKDLRKKIKETLNRYDKSLGKDGFIETEKTEKKILVVDDEKSICDLFKKFLMSKGFKTHLCQEPRKAIKMFSEIKPDMLILDLVMPDVDGMEILSEIKELKIKSKIIVLTGVHDSIIFEDAIKLGADDIIVKPCSMDQVEATIAKHFSLANKR